MIDYVYWLKWADEFIREVEEEDPENFTEEFRSKIAEFFYKMNKEVVK